MRLIDADFVKQRIDETMSSDYVYSTRSIKNLIDEAPTIDAEPVRHGKWIFKEHIVTTDMSIGCFVCSECGCVSGNAIGNNYCFHCGAKMETKE